MVVDQVNIADGIRLLVVPENQAPVSGYGQAPESFHVTFETVQVKRYMKRSIPGAGERSRRPA